MSIRERERFKKIFALATELANELKLDYYTSDPKRLNLQEALFLVASKKQLPEVAIPAACKSFPWKVAENAVKQENFSDEKSHWSDFQQSRGGGNFDVIQSSTTLT